MNTRRVMTWVIFWGSVVVALGALAWVSVEVVALERREAESRMQATRQDAIRRALWRLDSTMAPVLAIEAARPSSAYTTLQTVQQTSDPISAGVELDQYARQYFNFVYGTEGDDELAQQLQSTPTPEAAQPADQPPGDPPAEPVQIMSKQSDSDFEARNRIARIVTQNASPRQNIVQQDAADPESESMGLRLHAGALSDQSADAPPARKRADTDPTAGSMASREALFVGQTTSVGTLTPRWIQTGGETRLVLVRDAIVDGELVVQGVELDWDALRSDLLGSIADVLPGATLTPSGTNATDAYRMATIPVSLIPPPPAALPAWSWSPARVGLVVTWVAIIATIVAVGAVLRAAIVLSQRRGRFVSAVTHELRTPLTTFRLYAQMLADGMVSDEQVRRDYLSTLKRESERLTGIVENVLEYARLSRVRSGRTKPEGEQTLSPGALVARFRPALARRLGQDNMDLVASLDLDEHQDRTLTVDPHAVERVMMNLIENACKYAAPVDEEADSDEHDTRVHLEVSVRDEMLELLIADHGPGIPHDERARVFGEFQRGRRGLGNARSGLGLGLALSRGLAREMGGDLQLVRRRGHGAEFLLTIPLDPDQD